MNTNNPSNKMKSTGVPWWGWALRILGITTLLVMGVFTVLTVLVVSSTSLGGTLGSFYSWLLAAGTTQRFWYVTRAAGITGYLLLWLSTAWGLAVPSRILQGKLHGTYTFDFHQFVSLLAIGFIALHVGILMLNSYLPFSFAQLLVPFIAPYRPLWVGVGVLSMYIVLLVTVTFYIRDRIGSKAFRIIHVFSLLAFFGAALHGYFSGTDSPLPVVKGMYGLTFLSVVFLLTYWLANLAMKKSTRSGAGRPAAAAAKPDLRSPAGSAPRRPGQVSASQANPRARGSAAGTPHPRPNGQAAAQQRSSERQIRR